MRIWFMLAALALPLLAEPLSKGERDRAMSHLHGTRKLVLDMVAPLSDAQYNFKPAPDRWSIAECLEHISETENMLRGMIQSSAAKLPIDEAKRAARAASREASAAAVVSRMADRSQRASAPGEIRPTGRFKSKADAVAAFQSRRDTTIHWVETTPDDLRGRFFAMGPNEMDLYEMVLMISGHTERHLLQMKEVAATPSFPKR